MKIKRINTLFALAGIVLAGCSNEDLANVTPQEEGTGNVSFSIVEKDYEPADNTSKSRAAIEETKPEIQDLGNGLIAEVSLVPDTTHRVENPKTRAINTPTHYTIQAFQGGVKKGELKGTFNGSTFTPDAGQPKSISLPHGTYDFVCFNDGVTANGTQLTVNRADAGTARFDVQRVQINQDPKQQVKFTMKHAGAAISIVANYMNFILSCKTTSTQYTDRMLGLAYKGEFLYPAEQYKFSIETSANTIPESMVYDFTTKSYTYPTKGHVSKLGEADAGGAPVSFGSPGLEYNKVLDELLDDYWLPTTYNSELKLTFSSGSPYDCSLTGKSIKASIHRQVEANKRYTILIRLYITKQYLYSDGTTGPRDKNSTKIPIGVICNLRRASSDSNVHGVAVALHDVKEGGIEQIQWNNVTTQETPDPLTSYSDLFRSTIRRHYSNPAVQSAANYIPRFGTNYWSTPTFMDFLEIGRSLGKMLEDSFETYKQYRLTSFKFIVPSSAASTGFTTPAPSSIDFPSLDITYFNNAFTNEGGEAPSGTYWTATECKDGAEYKQATVTISGGKYHLGLKSKTETAKIRPFIQF